MKIRILIVSLPDSEGKVYIMTIGRHYKYLAVINHAELARAKTNPILIADECNWWESKAVFNCSVLYDGNIIHMLYRAVGEYDNYVSRIGYATSTDGLSFQRRKEVALYPVLDYEAYGMEDPRLTSIDNRIYITYVVLSNHVKNSPIASTALAVTDDFYSYKRLGIITVAESDNKDVVLFPKENGQAPSNKYFMLHRPSKWIKPLYDVPMPSIWLAEGDSVTNFFYQSLLIKPEQSWEELKVGAGVSPLKTKKGWLVIYHGVSADRVYSAGAFLLDLNDPYKILGRTKEPILTPRENYEKNGDVNNVVFPTGACIIDGKLLVYYGGADKVCCLATVDLDSLLEQMLSASCSN
jgi:beta-1,2-mannobiose phosphorylase / 1,2-beta-oligomannan phosphorylase